MAPATPTGVKPHATLWELCGPGGTINHTWTGDSLTLLNQYVAGVATLGESDGYVRFSVDPGAWAFEAAEPGLFKSSDLPSVS